MARPRSIEPPEDVRVRLDPRVKVKVDLWLHSDVEGRVPYGEYKRFFTILIERFFSEKDLDLAPYLGSEQGALVVRAAPHVLTKLIDRLKGDSNA